MMSQRRKLIIVVLIVLALVTVIVLGLGTNKKQNKTVTKDVYETTCESMIAAITKKDFDASYKLLSDFTKKIDTLEEWRDKTAILGNMYRDGEVKLSSRTELPKKKQDQAARVQMFYNVDNQFAASDVNCIVTQQNDQYVVDSFASQMVDGGRQ